MNPTTTYYGPIAYEGFARAMASKMGLTVNVKAGGTACIDAHGTISIPDMHTYQTETEFERTCGVIIHEMSHQFYQSNAVHARACQQWSDDLTAACMNAVLDVADETWVAHWFSHHSANDRPGYLLDQINYHAATQRRLWEKGTAPPHWQVLCTGILKARVGAHPQVRWAGRHVAYWAAQDGVDARKAFRIIGRARRLKSEDGRPNRRRFRKLVRLAEELAVILRPYAPPPGSSTVLVACPAGDAVAKGSKKLPKGGVEATEQQGADKSAGSAGGSADASDGQRFDACEASYGLLAPTIRRIADRMALDGEGLERSDGLTNGGVVGQAFRIATDGHCMARWNENPNAEGVSVAVLLDCSSSMNGVLHQCAGVARAFAEGMAHCAAVKCWAFGSVCRASEHFKQVEDLGGTSTHLALAEATEWLQGRSGLRWIVIVTDGCPCNADATAAECAKANAAGVRILAVGLKTGCFDVATRLVTTLPGALVAAAETPMHLAIELDNATRMIEAA